MITEEELISILANDGRCPKLNEVNELEQVANGGCMMVGEPLPGVYGMTAALSNRRLVMEIDALDNSMINKHIVKGDVLKVMTHVTVGDGDVVLAVVNDQSIVRAFFCDEDENEWLVPLNSAYEPILMNDEVEIVGKVVELNREGLFVNYKELSEAVKKARQNMKKPRIITDEQVSWVIQQVGPTITIARMWFAVFRAMTQKGVMPIKAYYRFEERVRKELPNHEKLPSADELQRQDILSFSKPIANWTESNAPVTGARFYKYKSLGERTMALLDADFENSRKTPENSTGNE
jgi:hypothetical protein